jgi:hypothetical protein
LLPAGFQAKAPCNAVDNSIKFRQPEAVARIGSYLERSSMTANGFRDGDLSATY